MADVWPLHGDGQRFENAGVISASTNLTELTEPGGINTKSAYTQLIAATAFDASGFFVQVTLQTNVARSYLFDIATGGAGSETVILANVLITIASTARAATVYIPLAIPAATRLSARYQASSSVTTDIRLSVLLVGTGWLGGSPFGNSETWGATAADSGGIQVVPGAASAEGSYAEIIAATARDVQAILVCVGNSAGDYAQANLKQLLEVAVGAAAAEQPLVQDLFFIADTLVDSFSPEFFGPIPCMIPAGSRVACRCQSDAAVTPENVDIVIIGFSL